MIIISRLPFTAYTFPKKKSPNEILYYISTGCNFISPPFIPPPAPKIKAGDAIVSWVNGGSDRSWNVASSAHNELNIFYSVSSCFAVGATKKRITEGKSQHAWVKWRWKSTKEEAPKCNPSQAEWKIKRRGREMKTEKTMRKGKAASFVV